mmetsp:Transcript_17043/g.59352  ORF Transcript_17043/g.59352 Transcript_17043/m.59352 type:complete len:350 (+) Transcript_17043:273-1322(+)
MRSVPRRAPLSSWRPAGATTSSAARAQPTAASCAFSKESPTAARWTQESEWQAAMIRATSASRWIAAIDGAASIGGSPSRSSASRRSRLVGGAATPWTSSCSQVSVPVLSKQQTSTAPAKAMRKGSVQKMPCLANAASELVTASDNSMGSSGGTTDVTMRMQCRQSLKRLRRGSARPARSTNAAAARAKTRSVAMKAPVSDDPTTRSVENRIVRINLPWLVSKPVLSATPTAPPSGGVPKAPPDPGEASRISVPPKTAWRRCAASRWSVSSSPWSASLRCGADSPVSMASFTTQPPETRTASQGTHASAASRAAARGHARPRADADTEKTSPGTRPSERQRRQAPSRQA